MSNSYEFRAGKCPDSALAVNNYVYVSKKDAKRLRLRDQEQYIEVDNKAIYIMRPHRKIEEGSVGMNALQRRFGRHALNDTINLTPYNLATTSDRNIYLSQVVFEVNFLSARYVTDDPFDLDQLHTSLIKTFSENFFCVDQQVVLVFGATRLLLTARSLEAVDMSAALRSGTAGDGSSDCIKVPRGLMMESTQVVIRRAENCTMKIKGNAAAASSSSLGFDQSSRGGLFVPDFSFENMGIGGLDKEFSQIFRRAFASRLFPPSVVEKLGIRHTRGMLLYGPPGTGKTLMARQIGKMLNGKEPKVVNGPEILNKYVGQSEENIRALFAEAEAEYKSAGEASSLHIIIFDEIDAICKSRGSTRGGTGVQDTVVNQLLSKIDGVNSLNNILVIGMTNRKDMIDEALLRPGRLEIQMEIGLPDEEGRLQIFRIHTKKMTSNGFLAADVDMTELANLTKNYTGAEIEGVVNSATSYALNRQVDMDNLTRAPTGDDTKITRADFLRGLSEVPPAFGVSGDEFSGYATNGIIPFGANFQKLNDTCIHFIKQVKNSKRTPLVSILLEGASGCGKTSLAAMLAKRSGFPYLKLITPDHMVGMGDATKCDKLTRIFDDAYKSPLSVIVIDEIERLLNYAAIGPHFSNHVLQTLLVLMKKSPPSGRKLLIIGTSSNLNILDNLEMSKVFNAILRVPDVAPGDEVATVLSQLGGWESEDIDQLSTSIPVHLPMKKLIMISEMAQQSQDRNTSKVQMFLRCMEDYGLSLADKVSSTGKIDKLLAD
mmetsp:Transcript_12856/g.19455  ORF Transcript_12856/g.19455 Transcript_12856/m.19455 type:complete len:772 (+) Transcript_12856:50-2365(+)